MTLLKLFDHDVKQCRLNSCAALYAISCAGRPICREIAEKQPMHKLVALVCPGVGRTSQDDQPSSSCPPRRQPPRPRRCQDQA